MSQFQGEQRCYLHPERLARISCQRCDRPICPADMREASVGFQCPSCVTTGAKTQRQPKTVFGGRISANPRSVTSILPSAFLHSGLMHIAFNMFALYLFGPAIEEALGRAKYLLTYITLAVAASVWVYWLSPVNSSTVGASGVVFGLLGMVLVFMVRSKQDVSGLLVLLALNVVISLQGNVSWQAHLGGFMTGLVLAAVFVYAPRNRQQLIHTLAFSGLWLVIIAATMLRTTQLWSIYG